MNRIVAITFILLLMPAKMLAQTEGKGIGVSGANSAANAYNPKDHLLSDSMALHVDPQFTTPSKMTEPSYGYHSGFAESSKQGGVGFHLWKGASVGVIGSNYHLPSMMDTSMGSLSLHQNDNPMQYRPHPLSQPAAKNLAR